MRLPIKVMQPVSLRIPPAEAWYPSLILDFTEQEELVVGTPAEKGEELEVPPGTELMVEVILVDGVRQFRTRVRRRAGAPGSLHLDWPAEATRIQRRDNVRVDAMVRAEATIPASGDEPKRTLPGFTIDVSAGGVRLNLAERVPDDTPIEMKLVLPEVGERECRGRVLRSGERKEAQGGTRYWNAVEFTDISEAVRRDITKFVFDVQRDQMRKG